MGFLGDLADAMSSTLSLGENTNHSLDGTVDGNYSKYGALGDFAQHIDQSAERRYLEEGFLRRDPLNVDPKQFEILMQQPNATMFIKKRMFSSIAENFRPDYMDEDEKLYYKSIKVLFANKCAQISALERLSKIQSVTSSAGSISDSLMPLIITLSDTLAGGFSPDTALGSLPKAFGGDDAARLLQVSNQLKKIYSFNSTNNNTTWINDSSNIFQSQFGKGTGTIEITNFTNFNTTVSTARGGGNFSVSISDPYEAMIITEWDIEKAIADATNMYKNSSTFQLYGENGNDQIISEKQSNLNKIRASRGASPVTIKVNPDTLLGKRVTAIFDRIGVELLFNYDSSGGTGFPGLAGITGDGVQVTNDYLRGGAIAGEDGLDTKKSNLKMGPDGNINKLVNDSELKLFQALITAIFGKIQLEANSKNAFQLSNKKTNYTRRKLRFNFSGKLIIQPMDIVHFYISSKSNFDNKLLGGLQGFFNGYGFVQSMNSSELDIKNLGSLIGFGESNSSAMEKAAYVGKDFPDSLWNKLRSQFVNENEGTHIFAGVVTEAKDSWNDGVFVTNITGKDNTYYFEQGKVNFKPGVDSFNGAIYDPLTPFKSNFDTISKSAKDNSPEYLEENKVILGTSINNNGLLKAKSGPFAGQKISSDHVTDVYIDPNSGMKSRVFHAPDGLTYKWKEGIGIITQSGSSRVLNSPRKVGNGNLFEDPFAGQDIMNTISLLITGQPYNYSNFWRSANTMYSYNRDSQSQQDSSHSYIASLQNELVKRNALWGNFIPFNNLVIDQKTFATAQMAQISILKKNSELDSKISQLQVLNDGAIAMGTINAFKDSVDFTPDLEKIKSQIQQLQKSVNEDLKQIAKEEDTFNQNLSSAGDASYNYSEFIDSSKMNTSASDSNPKKELRRQMNNLTRRMSYNVRANDDKNLFIVDDSYNKDYDIAAYNKAFTSMKLYDSDFETVKDKIGSVANLLDLEVFADTQGHIRVRPAQYNRMPSSIFYRMIYMKQAYGIQVFPQFLDDLFSTQIKTLKERVEILDDLIRLDCAIILGTDVGGDSADSAASQYILSDVGNGLAGDSFAFVSSPEGDITDLNQISNVANPDPKSIPTSFIDRLKGQAQSNKNVFPNTSRYTAIIKELTKQALNEAGYSINNVPAFEANTYVDQLISRIQTKSGQKIRKDDYLRKDDTKAGGFIIPSTVSIDIFKLSKELQEKLQERQKVIRLFYAAIANSQEFKSLDNDSKMANQMLAPSVYGNSNIPEVFEHMIEDESYNDYGGNSGSRYVIKRAQIRSLDISENKPDYTCVQVNGVFNEYKPKYAPAGFSSFPDGGNGLVTAVAVDYDNWRNYGFSKANTVNVPFLKDPNTQCGPYASMLLSRARKNILKGSLMISGNEYMQPGEVIYLEDRGLLFYVTSVSHSFNFGSTFTTTLNLEYGHTPGEYIPTPLDVIGKMIYNNRDIAGYVIDRQSNSGNESNYGVVQMDPNTTNKSVLPNTPSEDGKDSGNPTQNSFMVANKQVIDNMMYQAAYHINSKNTDGNNIIAKIELRVYHDDKTAADNNLLNFAGDVMNILIGRSSGLQPGGMTSSNNQIFPEDSVEVVKVNIDASADKDRRSPSQKAIDAARNQVKNNSIPLSVSASASASASAGSKSASASASASTNRPPTNDKIRAALFGYIVDCWIAFQDVPQKTTGGN